jgi:hypothetical protein
MKFFFNSFFQHTEYFKNFIDYNLNNNQLFRGQHVPFFADKILVYNDQLYCDPNKIIDGDIVYCDTHQLLNFIEILNSRKNLTLITHNSDYYVCDGATNDIMGINVDTFTCYRKWYAQNSYSKNPKLIPIPIGFENKKWEIIFGPKTKYMNRVSMNKKYLTDLVYYNCNQNTNFKDRKECYDFSINTNYVNIDKPNLSYIDYLKKIQQHKFILSPKGNGLDCHRTWEILKLKRVPILKRQGQLERLYSNMPVLFVDNWDDINKLNLSEIYYNFSFLEQDYLSMNYWFKFCKNN